MLLHTARHAGVPVPRDLRSHKMRRSQSALELSSMASLLTRQSSFQQQPLQKQVRLSILSCVYSLQVLSAMPGRKRACQVRTEIGTSTPAVTLTVILTGRRGVDHTGGSYVPCGPARSRGTLAEDTEISAEAARTQLHQAHQISVSEDPSRQPSPSTWSLRAQ